MSSSVLQDLLRKKMSIKKLSTIQRKAFNTDLATGIRDSLFILGYRDWLNVLICTLKPEYFLSNIDFDEKLVLKIFGGLKQT